MIEDYNYNTDTNEQRRQAYQQALWWYFDFTGCKIGSTEVQREQVKISGDAALGLVRFLTDSNYDLDSLEFIEAEYLGRTH